MIPTNLILNPTSPAFELLQVSVLAQGAPTGATRVNVFVAAPPTPITAQAFAAFAPPPGFAKNTQRNLQFETTAVFAAPGGAPIQSTLTNIGGFTWVNLASVSSADYFKPSDFQGLPSPVPSGNPFLSGFTDPFVDDGVIKFSSVYKAQVLNFDDTTAAGAPIDRYFIIDEWGNEFIMHSSGATTPGGVRAAFDEAVLPSGWRKEIRQLSSDLLLTPAENQDGVFNFNVIRDSADNGYHQVTWGASGNNVAAQIDGFEIWGGATNDRLVVLDGYDNTVYGAQGNDTILAGSGDSRLSGDAGNDIIRAGAGNDVLIGGAGDDLLTGRASRNASGERNTFVLGDTIANGNDRITDFDLNSGNESSYDTLQFDFGGRSWAISTNREMLEFVHFIEHDGDNTTDALIVGNDLVLAFDRTGPTGSYINSVRLEDVIDWDLSIFALWRAGADFF